jgi:bacterial/archaeal transporter family-2 protein
VKRQQPQRALSLTSNPGDRQVQWLLMPVAIGAGLLMVVQAACNSALERTWDRPITVGLVSLSMGISVLFIFGVVFGQIGLPSGKAAQAPWWAWLGGVCGAFALLSQPLVAPRLGAAVYVGLFVTASSVASVLADHFGWLGFQQHTAGFGRIAGCALMVLGIALVSVF